MSNDDQVNSLSGQHISSGTGISVDARLALPLNIKAHANAMTYHLLTRGDIEGLKAGSDPSESNMYSLCLGIFLTDLGVLIPLLVADVSGGRLISILYIALFGFLLASGIGSIYFGKKRKTIRDAQEARFNEVLENSATVVTFTADTNK